jgi:NADH-quinone oxidoreductase subunit N
MSISQIALQPSVILLAGGILSIILTIFIKKVNNILVILSLLITGAASIVALINLINFKEPTKFFFGNFLADKYSTGLSLIICAIAFVATIIMSNTDQNNENAFSNLPVIWSLSLFSISGMIFLVSTNDFISVFVAIELMTIPLYLAIIQKKQKSSLESSVKYLVLGGISSAILLFGIGFIYGVAKSIYFSDIMNNLAPSALDPMLFLGFAFVFVGFFFKAGLVPFHWWVPDVYAGSPAPLSGFMAALVKLASFGAFIRIVYLICPTLDLSIFIIPIVILTIIIGTLLAVSQRDIKRLLAYSSINHAGFVLLAIASFSLKGMYSSIFYLTIYSVSVIGSFGIVWLLRKPNIPTSVLSETKKPTLSVLKALKPSESNSIDLSNLKGLAKINPTLAVCLSIFLLSFAGLPLTGGFIAKYLVLTSGSKLYLIIIALIMSVVALFFYAKVIRSMFFDNPDYSTAVVLQSDISPFVTIILLAVVIIFLGVYPNLFIEFVQKISVLFA